MDPILVVKTPTFFRRRPPGVSLPNDCLCSTWILAHGKWIKVEDRAHPVQQQDRFDQWVERACFQYHPNTLSEPPTVDAKRQPGLVTTRHPASQVRPGASATMPTHQIQVQAWSYSKMAADIHTKGFKTPLHGKEHVCSEICWTLVISVRRTSVTWSHRLQMSTPRFGFVQAQVFRQRDPKRKWTSCSKTATTQQREVRSKWTIKDWSWGLCVFIHTHTHIYVCSWFLHI